MAVAQAVRKSILLIDDDPLVVESLTRLLNKTGYSVTAFQDPTQAIQETLGEDFDLVISDIRMPHIDGFQTLAYMREVRRQGGKDHPPEILITGYAEDYAERARAMKPHAVVFKPFDIGSFLQVVKKALNG